ncbi:hypothetical protein [Microbacterium elymi]|uniref:Uncharacterized protein n=1 Tax=Microbacterium elymi TaxID=2909587 RepID=A0ABY5NID7_9MICO|nr:hypothetical protein [Microbacterium elymi]UUT34947.1 hypothetical protein L2X98_31685 [Microbacterium elymi]
MMDAFPHRGVTLALVARVAGDQATVLLHPDAAFRLAPRGCLGEPAGHP